MFPHTKMLCGSNANSNAKKADERNPHTITVEIKSSDG
jgi:hypothetical protein